MNGFDTLRMMIRNRIAKIVNLEENEKLTRRILAVASLVLLGAGVFEWSSGPAMPVVDMVLAIAYLCAVLALPWNAVVASIAIIIVSLVNAALLNTYGPNVFWGALLALLILGMRTTRWISFSALLLLMLSAAYESALIPKSSGLTSVGALTSFLVAQVLAYCMGTALRWKDEANRRVETERQLSRLQRSTAIASQMHDAVSGKLSRIAILAHNVLPDIEQAEERERWRFVGETVEEALVGVRQIIDRLDGDIQDPLEGIVESDSLVENIRHLTDASDIRLHQQGFDGQSVVKGTTSAGLDAAGEELLNLIQELYTNIELHSDQTCTTYHFSIIVTDDRAVVSQTNGIKRSLSWSEPVSTGKGLKLHRTTISALGGVLKTSEEQGQWIVYAVLPLRNDHAPATVKRANSRMTAA
ncbi:hypothetical protein WM015_02600 [Bifidobacterium mongoliense]|uniref:hypothetical protein n=1 Tax=Bifidobacterium mongoliense TaxID=518643 RepID=UPI0030F45A8C